ncbi:hypothetical protein A2856_02605 [Candidatus Uhrbacteria bacterium RIFCSPHIGHO2_01_FULL_63_20]|uniref:Polyhydroxyalkanoate synthesis regulator n=1 Tax=Candidatus Uhrbacteria bacterium RIFCSPHIGHO2_01_FULL_63_20 TaxID=1802385 RepID=A0A1F7TKR5_9BACT|nr:MAG: hypothetical protein A2856_02605 [Candidatus Uhrbacteria bacterium RIFCSPHIGHO2_01_FULL_63_20]
MAKKMKLEEPLFIGLGVAALAKERAQDFLDYLVKEGKLAAKDQAKMRKELAARGKKEYRTMSGGYDKAVRETLKMLDIPTRSEFEALKRQVAGKKKKRS